MFPVYLVDSSLTIIVEYQIIVQMLDAFPQRLIGSSSSSSTTDVAAAAAAAVIVIIIKIILMIVLL